jgi:hypothetical protein
MISFTLDKWDNSVWDKADEIGLYIQQHGGYIEIHRSTVEFYISPEYRDFVILKYPFLTEINYIL